MADMDDPAVDLILQPTNTDDWPPSDDADMASADEGDDDDEPVASAASPAPGDASMRGSRPPTSHSSSSSTRTPRSASQSESSGSESDDGADAPPDDDDAVALDEDAPEADAKPGSASAPALADPGPADPGAISAAESASASAAAAPTKRKVKRRHRSPSPAPLPPPPLTTWRLDISLGNGEEYEVDILELARSSGQRPLTPKREAPDTSDTDGDQGDGDDEAELKPPAADDAAAGPSKPPVKRRKKKVEWYDVDDDFIDDSEIHLDERTTFAQTKQKGFYVSQGEVALVREKTPRKPSKIPKLPLLALSQSISASATAIKSRPPASTQAVSHTGVNGTNGAGPSKPRSSASASAALGTRESPIALMSDDEERKRKATAPAPGEREVRKKRKKELKEFSPELTAALQGLKDQIDKENWGQKGKFPPTLKPPLKEVAILAIRRNEYDDNFFDYMPTIFPYNRYTMTKLIKRSVCEDHVRILAERQDGLLEQLRIVALARFPQAQDDFAKASVAWEAKQDKARTDAPADAGANGTPGTGSASLNGSPAPVLPTPVPTPAADDSAPPATQAGAREREAKAPTRRYRLNDEMKRILFELVLLSNECVRLENEKHALEGAKVKDMSEQGTRKTLYQKIVNAFPDGWMTSGQISREVSLLKKKLEKETMEAEADG